MTIATCTGLRWPRQLLEYVDLGGGTAEGGDRPTGVSFFSTSKPGGETCRPVKVIPNYRTLIRAVSALAALNPGYQFYYRGQSKCYYDGGGSHLLVPGLWREGVPYGSAVETLRWSRENLVGMYAACTSKDKACLALMREQPLASWAILQHYEVCKTPLLDVTRTLQVACSFALMGGRSEGYVYVLALPYQREQIATFEDDGVVMMSLLGVTPFNAMRPLMQDGFLLGPSCWRKLLQETGRNPFSRDEYDFRARVAAVFRIDGGDSFWIGSGLSLIEKELLMPTEREDPFYTFLHQGGLLGEGGYRG